MLRFYLIYYASSRIYWNSVDLQTTENVHFVVDFWNIASSFSLFELSFKWNIHKINLHIRTDRKNPIFCEIFTCFSCFEIENQNKFQINTIFSENYHATFRRTVVWLANILFLVWV